MKHAVSFAGLLRHGQTEDDCAFNGSTDVKLTPLGYEQMWAAASLLSGWQNIVASPLRRCAEFAHALAKHALLPLEIDDRLREIHFGAWEGRSREDIAKRDSENLRRFWDDPGSCQPPGGEPLAVFEARVLACWQYHLQRCEDGRVLFVTHGGPIRAILGHVYSVSWPELLRLELPHGSLTCIRVEDARNGTFSVGAAAVMSAP